ncbi:hypothetical protein JMJ77_0005143 [Colletotrichum scovillei]|uniref:Uncharacterized protein n=1 Tax=Colletotrichum scovillei TaxID=1209932 RepID=A0A9P7UM05_9PEZI|nr:hypothetical protein JMJ77_0005143 [Colletotrichum scovillei]KAG7076356.1 hypothetical protein JMJ76_0013621 [Colletotrichum scovillei]KAG7083500.1 hypothetical protein JMJ78_0008945 [Colletotrichum scovillei]
MICKPWLPEVICLASSITIPRALASTGLLGVLYGGASPLVNGHPTLETCYTKAALQPKH